MTLLLAVGYAGLSSNLSLFGSVSAERETYDVYIVNVTPNQSSTVKVTDYFSTVMMSSASGGGTATFSVTVKNSSDKTYVYERIVTGAETGQDEIYSGEGITYSVSGIAFLTELAPNEAITFEVTMRVASGVYEDSVYTYFKFIEKTGEEILPDGEETDEPETERPVEPPESETDAADSEIETETQKETETETQKETETEHFHSDMLGLAEALRSSAENCLNDSDVIWNAVQTSITKHRPKDMPAMVHCLVQSISGGNMVNITTSANDKLTSGNTVHFVIAADESDPNRLFLYMYYEDECHDGVIDQEITTYLQVITRADEDSKWEENGTYKGKATVAEMWGGGNKNDYRTTIDPRTWVAVAIVSE